MTDEQIDSLWFAHNPGWGAHTPKALHEFAHALLAASPKAEPTDMVLNCPKCGLQHVDEPETREVQLEGGVQEVADWTNPPHRSHLCHGCGNIWRPADVPTNGVAAIKTVGKADSPKVAVVEPNRIVVHNFRGMLTNVICAGTDEKRREFAEALLKGIEYEINVAQVEQVSDDKRDAARYRKIAANSSVGKGLANCGSAISPPRHAWFIRFPVLEGQDIGSAVDALAPPQPINHTGDAK